MGPMSTPPTRVVQVRGASEAVFELRCGFCFQGRRRGDGRGMGHRMRSSVGVSRSDVFFSTITPSSNYTADGLSHRYRCPPASRASGGVPASTPARGFSACDLTEFNTIASMQRRRHDGGRYAKPFHHRATLVRQLQIHFQQHTSRTAKPRLHRINRNTTGPRSLTGGGGVGIVGTKPRVHGDPVRRRERVEAV